MPITGIGSYIPTMQEFQAHWTSVNATNPTAPLTLPPPAGGYLPPPYDIATFINDEAAIAASMSAVTGASATARLAVASLGMLKAPLRERVTQFRMTIQLNMGGTRFVKQAPAVPRFDAIETKFLEPLDAVTSLWTAINASQGTPLLLPNNYPITQWNADLVILRTAFMNATSANNALSLARATRDNLLAPMHERLKQYRTAVVLYLPANSPLLQTVPRLSPIPGSTPPGLEVTGNWDEALLKAQFSWPASTFPQIQRIQVRACTGGTWKNGDDLVVDDLPTTATSYESDWGLEVPGSTTTFKFFVMSSTGNENGGKAVKITRPTG